MGETPGEVQRLCRACGSRIPAGRLRAVPGAALCVACQSRTERHGAVPEAAAAGGTNAGRDVGTATVTFAGDSLAVGDWSEGFLASAERSAQVHALLDRGEREAASALVRSLSVEAQAALVTVDADPEQVLSLTGMGLDGKPAYRTDVIDLLPADLLTEVISVDPEEKKFNTQLMRAMSAEAFGRTLAETMALVDHTANRSKVAWEWLVALSEMGDANQAGRLLSGADPALLEEAILDHLEALDLHGLVPAGDFGSISRFRLFSEKAEAATSLAEHIEDPETRAVIGSLSEAAPGLLRYIVRAAWEVSGGTAESESEAGEGGGAT